MRKSLSVLGILGFSMAVANAAQAADGGGFFVQASAGNAELSGVHVDDHASFGQLAGGYRWSSGFGVEFGYMGTGDFSHSFDVPFSGQLPSFRSSTDVAVSGWMVGGNWRHRIGERGYFTARSGLFDWDMDVDSEVCNSTCERVSGGLDGTDYYLGIGGGYDLTANVSLGLSYDFFRADLPEPVVQGTDVQADISGFSLTAQWRF